MTRGVQLEDVSAEWNDFRLRNIDLQVDEKEYFVVLGPSGAGKTLLLECIAGFHSLKTGSVLIQGRNVTPLPPEKRHVGFVFEEYALFPHMSVEENIRFPLQFEKMKKVEKAKRVDNMMDLLGIRYLKGRNVGTLSSGEKQRVSIARALVMRPDVLLLDEPLSALDRPRKRELQRVLWNLHEELATTIIHVTHDQRIAASLANRIAIIRGGEILEVGTKEEIFYRPKHLFTADFVGFENTYKGNATCKQDLSYVNVQGTKIISATRRSGEVFVSVRPEDIILSKERFKSSAKNVLQGEIVNIIDRGPTMKVKVKVGSDLDFFALLTQRSINELNLQVGVKVFLTFKATAVRLFQSE